MPRIGGGGPARVLPARARRTTRARTQFVTQTHHGLTQITGNSTNTSNDIIVWQWAGQPGQRLLQVVAQKLVSMGRGITIRVYPPAPTVAGQGTRRIRLVALGLRRTLQSSSFSK